MFNYLLKSLAEEGIFGLINPKALQDLGEYLLNPYL